MKTIMSLSITPIGQGESLSEPISEVVETIRKSGVPYEVGSMWTSVESDWDTCLKVLDECRETLSEHSRLEIHVKFDVRKNARNHTLKDKAESVR